jgi:hypothetical protein
MATLEELVNQKVPPELPLQVEAPEAEEEVRISLEWIKAQTGDGVIEDYMDHPLNFNRSRGMARVLRGLTGLIGGLNFALADIVIGAMELFKSRTQHAD